MGQGRAFHRPAERSTHSPGRAHTLERKEWCAESHCILGITLPIGATRPRPQANIPQNNANKPNDC